MSHARGRASRRLGGLVLTVLACLQASCTRRADRNVAPGRDTFRVEVEVAAVARKSVAAGLELTGTFIPRDRSVIVSEVDAVITAFPKPVSSIEASPEQREFLRSIGVELDARTTRRVRGLARRTLRSAKRARGRKLLHEACVEGLRSWRQSLRDATK